MLFNPKGDNFIYEFYKPKYIHKYKDTYTINHDNTLFLYQNNTLINTFTNVVNMYAFEEKIFYVTNLLYYYNLETNEEKCFDFHFKNIMHRNDWVVGYTKYKCYVIDITTNKFISKAIIIEQIMINDNFIFISSGGTLYIYDYNLKMVNIVECEFEFFLVNERIIILFGENILFYKVNGNKIKGYKNELKEFRNLQIYKEYIACQNDEAFVVYDVSKNYLNEISRIENNCYNITKNKKLNADDKATNVPISNFCVNDANNEDSVSSDSIENELDSVSKVQTETKSKNFILNESLFIVNDERLVEFDIESQNTDVLLYNFESLYVMNNIYSGKIKDKLLFFSMDGNLIDTLEICDTNLRIIIHKSILISYEDLQDDKIKTKLLIISDHVTLKTKILCFDRILNIESDYIICINDNIYYNCSYNGTLVELKDLGDVVKVVFDNENMIILPKNHKMGDLEDILDFYIISSFKYYITINSIKIYEQDLLIGDIQLEYKKYVQFKDNIVFLTSDDIVVINKTVEHVNIVYDDIYTSGEFFVGVLNNKFCFTRRLSVTDELKETQNKIEERNVKITGLAENVEQLSVKADVYEKQTKDVKDKIKKWWLF